jgi:hypothetical protein
MLISDQKEFIFVHIYKTGGSSLTRLLGHYVDEKYRSPVAHADGLGWQKTWHYGQVQHAPLSMLRDSPEWRDRDISRYRICTTVRNPYSWVLSIWNNFYRFQESAPAWFSYLCPDRTFLDFCRMMNAGSMGMNRRMRGNTSQSSFIDDPELKPFFIARFERLEDDVRQMLSLLDIPAAELPHRVRHNPEERSDPLSFYNPESLAIVNKIFADDFNNFDYPILSL